MASQRTGQAAGKRCARAALGTRLRLLFGGGRAGPVDEGFRLNPGSIHLQTRFGEHLEQAAAGQPLATPWGLAGWCGLWNTEFPLDELTAIDEKIRGLAARLARGESGELPTAGGNGFWFRVFADAELSAVQAWLDEQPAGPLEALARTAPTGHSGPVTSDPIEPTAAASAPDQEWRRSLALELRRLPAEFAPRFAGATALAAEFRRQLAEALVGPFNAQLAAMPHERYEDKLALARWANAKLRSLGLAFRCPKSDRVSILLAVPGHHPDVGRFQLENVDAEGRKVRSFSFAALRELPLVPDDGSRAPDRDWGSRFPSKAPRQR